MSQVLHALKSAGYSITNASMHDAAGTSVPATSTSVFVRAGGHAIFTIHNNDEDAYDVSIPFDAFAPVDGGPANPINESASGSDTAHVPPRDGGVLVYLVKPATHFPFSPSHPTFHYKYSAHYKNLSTGKTKIVDPDLEVAP